MAHEELENARAAIRRAEDVASEDEHRDVWQVLQNVDDALSDLDDTDDEQLREDRLAEVKQELNRIQDDVTGELGSYVENARKSIVAYEKARL
jgi:ribosome recycling factor